MSAELSTTLHLHRRGSGPPLLLIHGIGHRWQAWEPVLDRLAAAHDVIALDLPGFGESPLPGGPAPLDIPRMVASVREVIGQLGLERPHVAGNSLGGALALELAAAGSVASATALSPGGFGTGREQFRALLILCWMRAQTFLPEPVLATMLRSRAVRALSMRMLVVHPDRLDRQRVLGDALALRRARGFRQAVRALRDYRLTAEALEPARYVPVTVAWAQQDRILPPRQAERARARMPWARHLLLPDCGHLPMSDDPQLVTDTILTTTAAAAAG